jgi:cyclopropane-fatty-acyl-phospholipid synthase
MNAATEIAITWVERGLLPDAVVRAAVRRLCERRLREIAADDCQAARLATERFVQAMGVAPIAPLPHLPNAQHYELPPEFFALALGAHRKYSSGWWPAGTDTLNDAEAAALSATCAHAELADGQTILELGCGWGSLTLWMASHYPRSHICAVSNSNSQRAFILAEAERRGLRNLELITRDMNEFSTDSRFDRVISIEMFEHMRNWQTLFTRVHEWLRPGGRCLLHVFCHRSTPYAFEDGGPSDWMSRYFFAGGMMPSEELALRCRGPLRLLQRWRWDGRHYERTANAWLANLDAGRARALPILERVYGRTHARRWLQRWRVFFIACAETFGYRNGQEWWVSHYLFERPAG